MCLWVSLWRATGRWAWMVLVGLWVWRGAMRGAGGGLGAGGEAGRGRDARAPGGGVRGVVCVVRVRGAGGHARWPRTARVASGRAHRLLRGHRRSAVGRRRRAGLQPIARRHLSHVPCRRLSALSAKHHPSAALHRAARRWKVSHFMPDSHIPLGIPCSEC